MAEFGINGSLLGSPLQKLLMCDFIEPGATPSYELCKIIYEWHPLGAKMTESPIKIAQSQPRDLEIPGAPDQVKEAFLDEWRKIGATQHIRNFVKTSRIYGIASIALLQEGISPSEPVEFDKLWDKKIAFNVLDPLNTAGSLVLDQNPNSFFFQKHGDISVSGVQYHRSRTIVLLNEDPVYISYTSSAFGFVGRSIFQRALFPLKTFVQSMRTDDLVVVKSGVIVAKMKQVSSAVNNAVSNLFGVKRNVVKEAITGNVISISTEEAIESLDLKNLEGPYSLARNNVLKNIATAADMPAKFLDQETMVEGFGEGSEDAKNIARYINDLREHMATAYAWFDKIVMHRAWNPDFYATIQSALPEQYGKMTHEEAFYKWSNAFRATWPSLLIEPESERAKGDEIRVKSALEAVEVLGPTFDPENKGALVQWAVDVVNESSLLFKSTLSFDKDLFDAYTPPAEVEQQEETEAEKIPPKPQLLRTGG